MDVCMQGENTETKVVEKSYNGPKKGWI